MLPRREAISRSILIAIPFGLQLFPLEMLYGLLLLGLFGVGVASLPIRRAAADAARRRAAADGQRPDWLFIASRFHPLTYLVEAERALFVGDFASMGVLYGKLVVLAFLAIGLAVGAATINKASL